MQKVKILGAGLSGLTAAINLKKAGFEVEVFERNFDTGARFSGDLQGLENWSSKRDVLLLLEEMGLKTNFSHTVFSEAEFTNGADTAKLQFKKPLFYLVKRGTDPDTLDQALKKQAQDAGVKINYQATLDPSQADIIATGPNVKSIGAVAAGITFKTDRPDIAVCLINNEAAFQGYSYFLVVKGYACICAVVPNKNKLNDCFKKTVEIFTQQYNLKIENPKSVGGFGSIGFSANYKQGDSLLIGEAAGIQDFLAGFGMKTAIQSGYLAARSIIENKDYTKLAKKQFKNYLKSGLVNRYSWEKVAFDNYIKGVELIQKNTDPFRWLRYLYNFGLTQRLKYPFALNYIKKTYPHLKF